MSRFFMGGVRERLQSQPEFNVCLCLISPEVLQEWACVGLVVWVVCSCVSRTLCVLVFERGADVTEGNKSGFFFRKKLNLLV